MDGNVGTLMRAEVHQHMGMSTLGNSISSLYGCVCSGEVEMLLWEVKITEKVSGRKWVAKHLCRSAVILGLNLKIYFRSSTKDVFLLWSLMRPRLNLFVVGELACSTVFYLKETLNKRLIKCPIMQRNKTELRKKNKGRHLSELVFERSVKS